MQVEGPRHSTPAMVVSETLGSVWVHLNWDVVCWHGKNSILFIFSPVPCGNGAGKEHCFFRFFLSQAEWAFPAPDTDT